MEMYRAYTEKSPLRLHQACAEMEPAWQKEKRKALEHLEEGFRGRSECFWGQIEKTVQDRGRWRAFVGDLCSRRKERF